MPVPYDPTTTVGKVRLLVSDTDPDQQIFTDPEISVFLSLEGSDVRLAAALALDTMASNEAMVAKKITILDLAVDGPAVAKELRAHAAALRTQVDAAVGSPDDAAFEIAELVTTDFAWRSRVWNQILLGG